MLFRSSEWAWPQGVGVFVDKEPDDPFRVEIRLVKAEEDAPLRDDSRKDDIR